MEVSVAFGRTGLRLRLPEGPRYAVLRTRSAAALADGAQAVGAGLDAPIGCAALETMARGRRTAAISVCDITRPAPNRVTLPPLLERLRRAGLRREEITLCIATGLHRGATAEELETILGAEVLGAGYPVYNHDARRAEQMRVLGVTRSGTPVAIARAFAEAELRITLGFIEQHLMLGFSGGRKMVAPGLAGEETIRTIHSPRFMREPQAVEGSIAENPLHAELLEIARMAGHDFVLDVTLTPEREISGVFAGEPVAAHAAGVQFVREQCVTVLEEKVDAAVTTAAGFPLDLTFYQAIKGITAVAQIVKPGGTILMVGECAEGAGSREFAAMLCGYTGAQEFLDRIAGAAVQPDQWMLEKLAVTALQHRLLFYVPGVQAESMGSLGRERFVSAEAALHRLAEMLPEGAQVAVVPEGPYTFARVRES
jgi:nickel-dependent lactate racemase